MTPKIILKIKKGKNIFVILGGYSSKSRPRDTIGCNIAVEVVHRVPLAAI